MAPLDQKETIIALAKAAKKEGAILCADTKMPTYRKITIEDIKEILPLIDYIFSNENEAAYMTGETEPVAMAKALKEKGVKNIIVKIGEKGCAVCVQHIGAAGVKNRDCVEDFLRRSRNVLREN